MNISNKTKLQQLQRTWLVRSTLLLTALGVLVAALAVRAVWLQVFEHDFLAFEGDKRYNRALEISASRGAIVDRNGKLLAHSTPVDTVWADPKVFAIDERNDVDVEQLAKAVSMSSSDLRKRFEKYANKRFMYLQRRLTPEQGKQVMAMNLPGVRRQQEFLRVYPHGELVGHLLGFTNTDDVGIAGLELTYEQHLVGKAGRVAFVRDRAGRVVGYRDGDVTPVDGSDLTLSLDLHLQHIAYRELSAAVSQFGAKGGSIVMMDPGTGEILALVNQPGFNPNDTRQRAGGAVRNRAVTDEFEPGSTVKPFLIASALETGDYEPGTIIDTTPGTLNVGGHTIRDFSNYGKIDLSRLIVKSSNVGSAKIALSLEPSVLHSMYSRFGFGRFTYLGFPGEISGRLNSFKKWYKLDQAALGYGYGLTVTSVQLAQAYAVLATDGRKFPVTLLKQSSSTQPEQVVSSKIAKNVTAMLEQVVSPNGTGRRAIVPGYRVAGKTGTVHKVGNSGYAEDRYRALFAGFAPVSDPKFVLVVMVDEPDPKRHFGGQVAAPVFAKIMGQALRYRNIKPDALQVTRRLDGVGVAGSLDNVGDSGFESLVVVNTLQNLQGRQYD